MFSIINKLFGKSARSMKELVANGAAVIDVRTRDEFRTGHAEGSINIPLDIIQHEAPKLKKYPHVILCCRSGSRSGYARILLKKAGLTSVTNGGSWQNVQHALKQSGE